MDNAQLLDTAIEAATIGGRHALENISRRKDTAAVYAHDIKLVLDRECQEHITAYLAKRCPGHAILGEEDRPGEAQTDLAADACEWILDPIDGTVNFYHGLPIWCCSVAVRRGGEILAGAVYAPELDALYAGAAGQASTCNGKPIRVSATPALDQAIVMTGLDKQLGTDRAPLSVFSAIALNTRKARVAGAAAVDLCWVAAGGADGYFEGSIYIWDIAAAKVIIEGAGGRCEVMRRYPEAHRLQFIATNGRIHQELKACLAAVGIEPQPDAPLFTS